MVTMIASTLGALLYNDHRFTALNDRLNDLGTSLRSEMNARFNAIDKRFDDLKDLLRSEIKRLEERLARERITR